MIILPFYRNLIFVCRRMHQQKVSNCPNLRIFKSFNFYHLGPLHCVKFYLGYRTKWLIGFLLFIIFIRIILIVHFRRPFLDTIKEIASSIKHLLDTTNAILSIVPHSYQPCKLILIINLYFLMYLVVEKRKREFVHISKRFSNTLKEYFKRQDPTQVI